jgi:hypothetical protein
MTGYMALLETYRRNMQLIVATMALVLLSIVLLPFLFPIPEEKSESMGTGGVLFCAFWWFVVFIIYLVLMLLVITNRSETGVVMGCLLSWVQPYVLYDIHHSVPVMISTVLPMVLTVLTIRMLWFIYQLARTPPPIPMWYYPAQPPSC